MWFGSFWDEYGYEDTNLILRTTTNYDMMSFTPDEPYAKVESFSELEERYEEEGEELMRPFLANTHYVHSLKDTEKLFPELTGMFKYTKKIPKFVDTGVAASYKPYYNLCHIFNN